MQICKQLEITELIRIKLIKTPTTKEPESVECDLGEGGGAAETGQWRLDWLPAQSCWVGLGLLLFLSMLPGHQAGP